MKQLEVPLLSYLHKACSMQVISSVLDGIPRHFIDQAPWPEFSYKPAVSFSAGHCNDHLFIKYYVHEAVVKATHFKANDPVYKDSCVEFFVAFHDEKTYYNFEFNPIGACKLNYGTERDGRKLISEKVISEIKYFITIQNKLDIKTGPGVQWEITLMIPVEAFSEHNLSSLSGLNCSANFYKCGDDLPVPHFLAWSNVDAPTPNFHVRECFGRMIFL